MGIYGHQRTTPYISPIIMLLHERLPKRSVKAGRLSRSFGPNHCEKYGGTIRRAQNHYEKHSEQNKPVAKPLQKPSKYKSETWNLLKITQNVDPKPPICRSRRSACDFPYFTWQIDPQLNHMEPKLFENKKSNVHNFPCIFWKWLIWPYIF